MARELDIIPNLKWLVKQINNISLDKEHVILFNSTVNNINLQPGFSFITVSPIVDIVFPDPALNKGATIIIYSTFFGISVAQNGYEPFDLGFSIPLSSIQGNTFYKYYSTGTKWVGGVHF
jgi:hypothetical protein